MLRTPLDQDERTTFLTVPKSAVVLPNLQSPFTAKLAEMNGLDQDQERRIIDILIALPNEVSIPSLKVTSIRTIERLLDCSDVRAQEILKELRDSHRIGAEVIPKGNELDIRRDMPVGHFRWVRPSE